MAAPKYHKISSDIASDESKLIDEAVNKFGHAFDGDQVDVDANWTYYYTRMVPSHTTERIVIFRPKPPNKHLGCVRVVDGKDLREMIWDVFNNDGTYAGYVPAGCPFEAMVVEIKLITPRKIGISSAS